MCRFHASHEVHNGKIVTGGQREERGLLGAVLVDEIVDLHLVHLLERCNLRLLRESLSRADMHEGTHDVLC